MPRRHLLAARLALTALVACTLPAQADTPARLDLDRAWQAAVANDAVLRAARAGAESGREAIPLARAQLLPQIGISWARNKNELETDTQLARVPVHTRQDYYSSTRALTIRQPLIQPVQWATLRQAGAQVVEAEALLVQAQQQLATRLVDESRQGQFQGVLASAVSLASIVAPLAFSAFYVVVREQWPGAIWLSAVAVNLIAVPLVLGLRFRTPAQQTQS